MNTPPRKAPGFMSYADEMIDWLDPFSGSDVSSAVQKEQEDLFKEIYQMLGLIPPPPTRWQKLKIRFRDLRISFLKKLRGKRPTEPYVLSKTIFARNPTVCPHCKNQDTQEIVAESDKGTAYLERVRKHLGHSCFRAHYCWKCEARWWYCTGRRGLDFQTITKRS